jgi:hypothetical protein
MEERRSKAYMKIADSFVFDELPLEKHLKATRVKVVPFHEESKVLAIVRHSTVAILERAHEEVLGAQKCLVRQLANELALSIDGHEMFLCEDKVEPEE